MTKEEMEELKGLAASMGLYDDKNPCKRAVILGKAIQELEQEPILDKIRAEIKHFMYNVNPSSSESDYACNYILNIIDKYKAESEDKE